MIMSAPEGVPDSERPEVGEKFAPGFTKYHFDPLSLPGLTESTFAQRDKGECTVDKKALDVEEWDIFIRKRIGDQEKLGERKTAWVLDYLSGDEHPEHRDHLAPRRRKAVIVSVEGEADLFTEAGPLRVVPGDTIVVDGIINPLHSVEALTDRRAVVATYTY
jgi:hypothetical protein